MKGFTEGYAQEFDRLLDALADRIAAAVAGKLTARAAGSSARGESEIFLDNEGAADLFGVSKSWVEHHLKDLPPRRSVDGTPRWLKSDLVQWARNRPVYGRVSQTKVS
jgi:hypothetical protein